MGLRQVLFGTDEMSCVSALSDSRLMEIELSSELEVYYKESTVQQCINLIAMFTTQAGFYLEATNPDGSTDKEVLAACNEFNERVNMDDIITISDIKKEIYGRSGWQIIRKGRRQIPYDLRPLNSSYLRPEINTTEMTIEYFNYSSAKSGKYEIEQVLYFPRLPIQNNKLGQSAITPIMKTVNAKRTFIDDLKQSSKRLWAPMGIFNIDTSGLKKPEDKRAKIKAFKAELMPGRSIVVNSKIDGKIYDLKPDLNGIVKAIQTMDEEIIGNWGVPKALLAREKTVTKATLAEAVKALWQGPVASRQRFYKRALESQIYQRIAKSMGRKDTKVRLYWGLSPATLDPELINAMVNAVEAGIITKTEFKKALNWPIMDEN